MTTVDVPVEETKASRNTGAIIGVAIGTAIGLLAGPVGAVGLGIVGGAIGHGMGSKKPVPTPVRVVPRSAPTPSELSCDTAETLAMVDEMVAEIRGLKPEELAGASLAIEKEAKVIADAGCPAHAKKLRDALAARKLRGKKPVPTQSRKPGGVLTPDIFTVDIFTVDDLPGSHGTEAKALFGAADEAIAANAGDPEGLKLLAAMLDAVATQSETAGWKTVAQQARDKAKGVRKIGVPKIDLSKVASAVSSSSRRVGGFFGGGGLLRGGVVGPAAPPPTQLCAKLFSELPDVPFMHMPDVPALGFPASTTIRDAAQTRLWEYMAAMSEPPSGGGNRTTQSAVERDRLYRVVVAMEKQADRMVASGDAFATDYTVQALRRAAKCARERESTGWSYEFGG